MTKFSSSRSNSNDTIMHFLNIRWNFIMLGINYWYIFHLYPLFILNHGNHDCKSSHSFTIIWQDQTMSLIVKRFPKTHIPLHSFTEGLSGISALSFSPPFLPPLIVLLNCLVETCRIRAHLFPYQKVRYHQGSYWREIFVIIMTRIILVLFNKPEFDWGLIELFL